MGTLTNNSPSDDLRAYNISISLGDIYTSIICQLYVDDDFYVCATYRRCLYRAKDVVCNSASSFFVD